MKRNKIDTWIKEFFQVGCMMLTLISVPLVSLKLLFPQMRQKLELTYLSKHSLLMTFLVAFFRAMKSLSGFWLLFPAHARSSEAIHKINYKLT